MSCTKYRCNLATVSAEVRRNTFKGAAECRFHFTVSWHVRLSHKTGSLLETLLDTSDWCVYYRRGTKGAQSLALCYYIQTTGSNMHTRIPHTNRSPTDSQWWCNSIKQLILWSLLQHTTRINSGALSVVSAWILIHCWPLKTNTYFVDAGGVMSGNDTRNM